MLQAEKLVCMRSCERERERKTVEGKITEPSQRVWRIALLTLTSTIPAAPIRTWNSPNQTFVMIYNIQHWAFRYRWCNLFPLYPSSLWFFSQKAKLLLLSLLSSRVSMLGHAGHGFRFDHWQPDHSILPYGPELGTRECPPADQQDRLDPATPATAFC